MKALYRRDQFLKCPPFKNPWKDDEGRLYMFVQREKIKWSLANSNMWDDNDQLAHVRSGQHKQPPSEGDTITVKRGDATFKFTILRVFREVGRRRSKPMQISPV